MKTKDRVELYFLGLFGGLIGTSLFYLLKRGFFFFQRHVHIVVH